MQYSDRNEEIYALQLLQPLVADYPYLPFTRASLSAVCLAFIANDIVINRRQNIIEFGSGISTILIGRLIKKNHLNARVLSIENNKAWAQTLTDLLVEEQLTDVVTVRCAPLQPGQGATEGNHWYSLKVLKEATKNKRFDMVIIDGPAAWEPGKQLARYPAVRFISSKLENNFAIYLDDADRQGEQHIIKTWEAEYGITFNFSGKSFAYYHGGESFFIGL